MPLKGSYKEGLKESPVADSRTPWARQAAPITALCPGQDFHAKQDRPWGHLTIAGRSGVTRAGLDQPGLPRGSSVAHPCRVGKPRRTRLSGPHALTARRPFRRIRWYLSAQLGVRCAVGDLLAREAIHRRNLQEVALASINGLGRPGLVLVRKTFGLIL